MSLTIPSMNAGLHTYEMHRDSEDYRSRELLLKQLFLKFGTAATQYDIYEALQGIDRSVGTSLQREDISALKDLAESMPEKWKDCFVDTGYEKWWKFSAECSDPSAQVLSDLALIKVYVSVDDEVRIPETFCQAVRLLLMEGSNRFHAKVSRVKRRDSMCFWISRNDFDLLEKYFADCRNITGGAMPFIAYHGKLGISRELATFDSHNSLQAQLISSYFNSLDNVDEVDLGEMYSLLVKAWNRELKEEHPVRKAFQYSRAQGILLLLDTMDVITGRTSLDDDHFFLQENESLWRALGQAACWQEVEKFYQAALQKHG